MSLPHVELTYILQYGYLALFVILILSELAAFAPVGILLIALGALSRSHYFDFSLLLIVSTLGSTVADYIVYRIAKQLGKKEGYRRFVERNGFASRIEHYMTHHPRATISLSRLVGFAGVPVNAMAGLSGIPPVTYVFFDALGNFFCCIVYLLIGYYVGAAWQYDSTIASFVLGIIFTISLAGYLVFFLFRKKRKTRQ